MLNRFVTCPGKKIVSSLHSLALAFFLPEVREFITRHTAYNKHDTGWAKGAPSEDHTTPPSSRTASGGRLVGGAPAGARPFRGWLIPRVPYSGLVPYWEQTAVPATRPCEGDVC